MRARPASLIVMTALLGLLALGAHVSRTHAFGHHLQTQAYEDRYYLPPPSWLVISSLGYREALADLVWVALLENFGEELQHRGEARYFFHYGDAVIALDPYFKRVYEWMGTVSLYRIGKPTEADGERAGSYLEAALRLFPDDGELIWLAGAHYRFELPNLLPDQARKDASRRKGNEYLRAAALLGAGPPWLGLLAASNLESLGQKERAIRYLTELYMTAEDPETKAEIGERLSRLRSAAFLEAVSQSEIKLRQAREASFPYLDESLFLLVGPRPPFDEIGQIRRYFDPLPAADPSAP